MFRTTRKTAVLPLAAAALLLGGAGNAFALPINDDDPPPPPNQAPTAALTVSPNPALVSNPPVLVQAQAARVIDVGGIGVLGRNAVSFDASGSSDPDGSIAKYEWDLDGNGTFETSTATSPVVDAPFATVSTKTVRVKVTDIYNASSVASTTVGVHAAPDAKFSATPAPAVVGEQVQFDGSDSLVNEPVVKFEWDLDGNGTFETNTGANPKATSTYTAPGTVATQLRITDRQGAQDVETRNLTVLAQAPVDRVAPIVRITAPSSRMSKSGRVTLNVTCPAGERLCTGRVALRKAGARAAVGSRAFRLAGGQRASVRVLLSRSAQRTVKRRGRLAVRITANARDAAGNAGTARRSLTVRKPLR